MVGVEKGDPCNTAGNGQVAEAEAGREKINFDKASSKNTVFLYEHILLFM